MRIYVRNVAYSLGALRDLESEGNSVCKIVEILISMNNCI